MQRRLCYKLTGSDDRLASRRNLEDYFALRGKEGAVLARRLADHTEDRTEMETTPPPPPRDIFI